MSVSPSEHVILTPGYFSEKPFVKQDEASSRRRRRRKKSKEKTLRAGKREREME